MTEAVPAADPRPRDPGGAPLTGMTWDHPRGHRALDAFAQAFDAPAVDWHRQPLSAFEAHPVAELAREYDVMVIDHPGLGAAIEADALLPIEEVVDAGQLETWLAATVGRSAASYRMCDRTWAVPIDAAAQVAVHRRDARVPVPARWEEVPDVAAEYRVTLCLGGPHAMLTLLAMCVQESPAVGEAGQPVSAEPAGVRQLLPQESAVAALELLRTVHRAGDRETSLLDPIQVHEAIAAGGPGPVWCPLAYGYVSYARPTTGHALAWADAPGRRGSGPLSVLGGTGLAVSRRAEGNPAVGAWLTAYLRDEVQTGLVPAAGGQAAHRGVWAGPHTSSDRGGFYGSTVATLEAAWVRPRMPGWTGLQAEGSELVREAIVHGGSARSVVDRINRDFAALCRRTRSDLEPAKEMS
ncbi:carbohydrate ABC transporter substrate-binding protein [Streptomyces brasiliensis]|uniref:Membrane protein n=1 Tax=Streptomyces brasiliensis TaxID=1954 RepID=A0A917NZW4_9ACTN|nr:carbohydrate ABC transporter substrate-binding protein [Streptomyces brasiliensis]GGJ40556.1 membrane protein [Streptomyces brasiliensis]